MSERGIENHHRILEALAERNAERAAALMAADIQTFLDLFDLPVIQAALDRLGTRE